MLPNSLAIRFQYALRQTPRRGCRPAKLLDPLKGCTFRTSSHLRNQEVHRSFARTLSNTSTSSPTTDIKPLPTVYRPPQTGIISKLPSSWIPYAELIRLDKPAGTYYLYFPCLYSTLLAAPLATSTPLAVFSTGALFFAGALIMRGAGCTINDLWDRNLDPYVERTRLRPIARGAISPRNAIVYLGFQLSAGLGILLSFPTQCFFYGAPSLLLVFTYPLAKRVTNYPQFVLGLAFSWGAVMGFPALGVDLLANPTAMAAPGALYASCVPERGVHPEHAGDPEYPGDPQHAVDAQQAIHAQ